MKKILITALLTMLVSNVNAYEQWHIDWLFDNTRYSEADIVRDWPSFETVDQSVIEEQFGKETQAVYIKELNHIMLSSLLVGNKRDAVLIHELAHFMQWESGNYFACMSAMEDEAYKIQFKYEKQVGSFEEYDPIHLAFITKCFGQDPF